MVGFLVLLLIRPKLRYQIPLLLKIPMAKKKQPQPF